MSTNSENIDFSVFNSVDEYSIWQNSLTQTGLNIPAEYVNLSGYLDHLDDTTILDWVNWDNWHKDAFADDTNVAGQDAYQSAFDALVNSIPESVETVVSPSSFNFQEFGWNEFQTETTDYQFHWYGDNVVVEQFLIDDPDIVINQVELTHEQYNLIQDNGGNALTLIGVLA